jgi:hypothetical protein
MKARLANWFIGAAPRPSGPGRSSSSGNAV